MRKSSILSLVFITLFMFSLVDLSGNGILATDSGLSLNYQNQVSEAGGTYVGTGSPLTVSFSGTFTNASTWTQTSQTLSSEFAPGTSYSVANASSVTWTAYILVSPPPEVESLTFSVDFQGTEWRPTSLTNPVGVAMSYPSQWWYDTDTVYVSTSAVTTYGVWKLQFLGLNQLTNLQLGESSGPLSSTAIFDTNDEMLFRTTSTWIAGTTTEFVLTDPTGYTWDSKTNTTSGFTSHMLQSFAHRKNITVYASRHLFIPLTNFPVLIDIYDTDLHTKVQPDGDDIVFYAGGKIVPHEIELFNQNYSPTEAHLIAWVKVNLTASDTVISMYYGNPVIGPQERPEDVWTQNFAAVWHLNEDATAGGTSTIHYDSTSGNYDGTQNQNEDDTGKIGVGQRFDGSNDQIVISSSESLKPSGDVEISGWFKLDTTFTSTSPTTHLIFDKWNGVDNDMHVALAGTDHTYIPQGILPGSLVFKVENDVAGQKYKWTSQTTWTAGVWYHFSCTMDSGTPENNQIYINGALDTAGSTGTLAFAHLSYNGNWEIGGGSIENIAGYLAWFDGVIDDVRVSNTIRSAAWRSGSYSNQFNPSNFYYVSSEQQRVSPELAIKKIANSTAIAGVWKISAFYNDSGSSVNYRTGMYERTFTVMRSSSLTVTAPTAAIGNGVVSLVVGDILYTQVNLVDSLTGGITGATVAMNWTVSGVSSPVDLSDMGGGVYGIAVNTSDLETNVRWRINLVATHTYHRSSSTYFYLDLYHETRLDYSDLTTTPVGFDSNATLTFYDDFDGTRISGATIKFANGDPVTILSQANGVYHISVDTSSLAQGQYSYIINATKPDSLYVMATANLTFTIRPHYTALSVSGNLVTPFGTDTLLTVQLIDLDTGTMVNIADVTSLSFTSFYGTQIRATYGVTLTTNAWTVALTDVTLSAIMTSSDYYTPDPHDFQINIRKHYTTISVTGGLVTPYGNVTPLTIAITDIDTGTLLSASVVQSFNFLTIYSESDPISDLSVDLPTESWLVGPHAVTLQLTMKAASNYYSPSNYGFSITIRSLTTVLHNVPNDLIFPNGDDLVVLLQFNVSEHGTYYGDPIDGVLNSAFYVTNATYVYPKSIVALGNGIYQMTISSSFFASGPYTIFITVSPAISIYARADMVLNFEYRAARSDLTANLYTVSTPYHHNVTVTLSYIDLDRATGILTGIITSPDVWISYVNIGGGTYSVTIGVFSLNLGTHPINLTAQASGYTTRSIIINVIVTKIHTDAQPSVISLDMPVGNTKIFYIELTDLDNSVPIGNSSFIPADDWAGSVSISYLWTGTMYEVTLTTTGSDALGLYTIIFTFSPGLNYYDAACEIEVDLRTHITIFNLVSAVDPTPFNGIVNISLRYYDWDNKVGITDDTNIQILVWNQTDWIATNLINLGSGYYTLRIDASLFGQGLQYFDIYFNWIGPVQQYEDKSTTASVSIIGIDSQIALLSASEPTAYLGIMSYTFFYSELSGLGITNSSYGGGNVHISISFEGESVDLSKVTISEINPVLQPGKYSISFNTTIFGKTGLIYMNVYINWSAGVAPFYTNRADVISVRVLPRDTLLAVIPPSPTAYGENATFTFSFDDVTGGSSAPIDYNPAVLSVILSLDYSLSYNALTYLFTVSFNTSQFGAPLGQKSFTLGVTWVGTPFYANRTGRVIFITVTARQTTLDFQSPAPTSYLDNVTLTIEWIDVTSVPSTGISGAIVQLYDVTGAAFIPGSYYTVYWISGGQYELAFNTSYYSAPNTYSLRVYLSTPDFYIPDVSSTRSFNVRYRLTLLSAEPIGIV
ncbi:MAG: LamG domain-containing protein, partial [Candidatus Thorarchaeota archaeon]|nr:LamG domain-containing protein [Candidatus Thorarchaeota archaeon]